MDAMSPWPALIKRLRFLSCLKQSELAQQLGVEQGTVSRWERGVYVPDIPVQRVLRDMLQKLEPHIKPEVMEQMPVRVLLYDLREPGRLDCCSMPVAKDYEMDVRTMRQCNLEPLWTQSLRHMFEDIWSTDEYKTSEIAMVKAVIFRISQKWYHITAMPLYASNQMMFTAAETAPPAGLSKDQCLVKIFTADELV